MTVSYNIKYVNILKPVIPLLGIYPRQKITHSTDTLIQNVYGAFSIIAKSGNCPNVHQEENGHLVYSDNGLLLKNFQQALTHITWLNLKNMLNERSQVLKEHILYNYISMAFYKRQTLIYGDRNQNSGCPHGLGTN